MISSLGKKDFGISLPSHVWRAFFAYLKRKCFNKKTLGRLRRAVIALESSLFLYILRWGDEISSQFAITSKENKTITRTLKDDEREFKVHLVIRNLKLVFSEAMTTVRSVKFHLFCGFWGFLHDEFVERNFLRSSFFSSRSWQIMKASIFLVTVDRTISDPWHL